MHNVANGQHRTPNIRTTMTCIDMTAALENSSILFTSKGKVLKRHCIKCGVVRIDSAIVVLPGGHRLGDNSAFVNSAGQLLLPGGVRPEWITSA